MTWKQQDLCQFIFYRENFHGKMYKHNHNKNNTQLLVKSKLLRLITYFVKDCLVFFYLYLEQFIDYMSYVKNLKFEEKPDYMFIKRMFKDLFYQSETKWNYVYDWVH